ncbi:MAG: hypothetical protein CBC29_05335 [Methylococcaceae bacterium TMED69]|nr:MAG: hypothetical protein CBC29_05335 [Methylococcaceae bacterium TMED69]|tara:strand:+ start:2579 stop:2992 length:414 start_codon:yes stop_codon:yes gene_type:complete
MDTNFMKNFKNMADSAIEASKNLETINTSVIEKFAETNMQLATSIIEAGTAAADGLSDTKEIPDVISIQTGFLSKYNESVFDAAKSTASIMNSARTEYQGWFERGIVDMKSSTEIDSLFPFPADKVKKTAKKTAKAS